MTYNFLSNQQDSAILPQDVKCKNYTSKIFFLMFSNKQINNESIFAEFHMGVGGPLEAVTASAKLLHRQVTQRMLQRRQTKLTMLSPKAEKKQPLYSLHPGILSLNLTVNADPPAQPYLTKN